MAGSAVVCDRELDAAREALEAAVLSGGVSEADISLVLRNAMEETEGALWMVLLPVRVALDGGEEEVEPWSEQRTVLSVLLRVERLQSAALDVVFDTLAVVGLEDEAGDESGGDGGGTGPLSRDPSRLLLRQRPSRLHHHIGSCEPQIQCCGYLSYRL